MHPFVRPFSKIVTPILVFFVFTFGLSATVRADAIAGDEAADSSKVSALSVPRGTAAVVNSGEATFSIPLMVPPGVRGMRPQLTLQYSSAGVDVGLGVGWSLGLGFPDAVRRASRFGIPLYDDKDVFTFAGQDLVKVGNEWPVRYRTKIDSFQKIEHNTGLHGFSDWIVTERNGTRLEYGDLGFQSTIPGLPRVLRIYAWHLARVIDTFGNTIKFEYEGPDTARRLKEILYTYNESVAVGQVQKVVFHWQNRPDADGDNRPDALRDSIYGAEIVHDQRLDRIETYTGDRLLQVYDLVYAGDPVSGTQLTPVTHTWRMVALVVTGHAADESTDTLKWTFEYQETAGWEDDARFNLPDTFTLANRLLANNYDLSVRLVDVNGDGLADIIGRPFPNPNDRPNEVWLHNGSGWSRAASWSVPYDTFVGLTTGSEDFGIRVIDVNGDGLVDLLKSIDPDFDRSNDETQEIRLNNGSGWDDPNTVYRLPRDAIFAISGKGDGGVRFAEVNGDGFIDLLIGRQDAPRAVYFNNRTNGWNKTQEWVLPLDFASRHGSARWDDNGVRLGDVNADGLADLVRAYSPNNKPDEQEIRLNNGAGWNEPGQWTVPADVWFAYESSKGGSKPGISRIADFNGDGYVDLMGLDANTRTLPLYLNNRSNGFLQVPGLELPQDAMWAGDLGTRLVDVDGDGLLDMVHAHVAVSDSGLYCPYVSGCRVTYLSQSQQVDLLADVTNPMGGVVSLQYGHASGLGLPTGQMPFVKTVVSALHWDAGMSDPVMSSTYNYANAHYDFLQQEFYGFETVTQTRSDSSRRESLFYTDEGRRGIMKEQSLRDSDGKIYRKLRLTYSGATPDADGVYKTLRTKQEDWQYHQDDDDEFVFSQKYFTYDGYGNIRTIRERDWGTEVTVCEPFEKDFKIAKSVIAREVEPPEECWDVLQPGPTLHSDRITYTAPNEAAWIVSLPATLERFEGDLLSQNSLRLATFEFYYDDQTSPGAEPVQGRLTRKVLRDHRLEGMELASGSDTVVVAFEYDTYGNVTRKTNGRGFKTTIDYEGNGFLFAHSIARDNPGRPVIQRETIYDRGLGVLLEKTDLNDQITRYQYDGFGRTKMIINPGETSADPGLLADYRLDVFPGYTRIWRRIAEDDQLRYRVHSEFIDGLGRPKATVVGQDSNWVLNNLTRYDNRGRQNKIFEPFFQQNTNYSGTPPSGTGFTTYTYEDNKLSRTTFPDGASTRHVYSADGFNFYDENGVITGQRFDSLGRLVEVATDAGGSGSTLTITRYDYDGLGYMLASEDPRGLVTEYFHDARGLLRGLSDPDGGQQTLKNGYQVWNDYDQQGNHTHRWSDNDVLRTEYDALDRRTRREMSRDGGKTWSFESLYYYDMSSAQNKGIGRLGFVYTTPPTSYSMFNYDIRGRIERETFYYRGLDSSLPSRINIEYDYNRAGEVTGIREPTGRWIHYERNIFGQIEGNDTIAAVTLEGTPVLDAIIDINYDPVGRIKRIEYGHGLVDEYTYDLRGRMEHINPQATGLLKIDYTYDAAGNLKTEIHRQRPFSLTYKYDRLNRLQTATGQIGSTGINLGYDYDASGNLLAVSGDGATNVAYRYRLDNNRLFEIQFGNDEPIDINYDPHGNITAIQSEYQRNHTYDVLGRLKSYSIDSIISGKIDYDGRGRKVRRTLQDGGYEIYFRTFNGNVLATYKDGSWTSYILADGLRLAFVDNAEQIHYIHSDRLGSARMITTQPPQTETYVAPKPAHRIGYPGLYVASSVRQKLDQSAQQFCYRKGYDQVSGYATVGPIGGAYSYWAGSYWSTSGSNNVIYMEDLVCRHSQLPDVEVVWSHDYLPFGKEVSSKSGGDNFRFTGQELEPALGIYDYGARYYDPLLRRFIQLDHFKGDIEDPRTLNRYSYTLNNPTGYIDPTGNFADKILPRPIVSIVIVGTRSTDSDYDIDQTDGSDDKTKQYKDNEVRKRLLGELGLPTQIDGIDNFLGEEVTAYAKSELFSTDFRIDMAERSMVGFSSRSRQSQNWLAREFADLLEISMARAQYHLSQGKTRAHDEVRQNWELGRRAQQGLNQATRPLDWESASAEQKAAFLMQMGLFYLNSSAGYKAPGPGFNTGQKANGMPVTQKKGTFRGWGPGWK